MDIYREIIMDHYKDPRNFGEIENPDIQSIDHNSFCGDKIIIQANIEGSKIKEIKFNGEGCAISQASASLLIESIKEKNIEDIKKLDNEYIYDLIGVRLDIARTKCATLALTTLKKALEKK